MVILLIIAGWLWALFAARNGRRGGLIALFALSLLTVLFAVYDIRFVLHTPMPWPEQLTVVVMLVVGVIAAAAVAVYLKGGIKTV